MTTDPRFFDVHRLMPRRREVTFDESGASLRLGRKELEEKVGALEATLETEKTRHFEALKEASSRRDTLVAEVADLR